MAKLDTIREKVVSMEIGGRLRTLQFDMNAFAKLEEDYGSIQEALEKLVAGKITDVRKILWTSLIHDEAILNEEGEPISYNITPYQVGGWVKNPAAMTTLINKLVEALNENSPDNTLTSQKAATPTVVGALPEGTATVVLTEEEVQEKNA